MKLAVIALRNLARHRRRSLLSLLVIAAGAVAVVLTAGFIRFSFDGLREAIIHGGLGHLELMPAATAGPTGPDRSAPPALADWAPVRAAAESTPHVLAAGAAVYLTGMASKDDRSAAFVGVALEPDRERRMNLEVKLRGGVNLSDAPPAAGEDQVLLGAGLGHSLGARPGDVVTVTAMTTDGTLNALDVRVVGFVTTGLQELDARVLKTHLVTAERLLGTDKVSSIVIGLDDTSRTQETGDALARRLPSLFATPLVITDWRARAPFYGQVRALYSGIFWFLGGIVFVLVCLATSNTLLMSVLERIREFGTLLAIGTGRGQLALMVVLEALWLGVAGALLGDLLAGGLVVAINAAGIEMPPPPGAAAGFPLRLSVRPGDFIGVVGLMMVVLALAAVYPAARAVRLRIVEALGHV
ncbi:MAG TPA: FtsX-like permease family protein [Vicinamibacteria bacterium]|nr:FtsX-like permease family protein [Vicinamibacteria bacterium]